MSVEYKCVGAPEKGKRKRGAKSRSDRVAHAMEEVIKAEATDGWEYLRTDLIPVEERSGFFRRPHEVHRAVLVFRRDAGAAATTAPRPAAEQLMEPMAPSSTIEETPIRLAAERENPATSGPVPAPNVAHPPRGLG